MEEKVIAAGTAASLHVYGLFGRKRKPQREIFKLTDTLPDTVDVHTLVQAKLVEIGAKSGLRYSVLTYPWTEYTYGDGPAFRRVELKIGQKPTLEGIFEGK